MLRSARYKECCRLSLEYKLIRRGIWLVYLVKELVFNSNRRVSGEIRFVIGENKLISAGYKRVSGESWVVSRENKPISVKNGRIFDVIWLISDVS